VLDSPYTVRATHSPEPSMRHLAVITLTATTLLASTAAQAGGKFRG
jgi:hypothetical protein